MSSPAPLSDGWFRDATDRAISIYQEDGVDRVFREVAAAALEWGADNMGSTGRTRLEQFRHDLDRIYAKAREVRGDA